LWSFGRDEKSVTRTVAAINQRLILRQQPAHSDRLIALHGKR
jgi:hypothetical protein